MNVDPIFVLANYLEGCLWIGIGVIALVKRNSRASIGLALALLLFGVSDFVEVRTGAWYDPWWLFTWKASCVLAILLFGIAWREIDPEKAERRGDPFTRFCT